MPDPRTDQIAREAARLIEAGRVDSIDHAIHLAVDVLRAHGSPLPGHGRVRKHAQAMAMQSLGESGYERKRLAVWTVAEQIMAAFELAMPDAEMLLVGRAALGHIDAGVTIHLRIYTDAPINQIADVLDTYGYGEYSFQTVDATSGRLNQISLEDDGYPVVITRCPHSLTSSREVDLFTGKPIPTMGISALRWQLNDRNEQE